LEGAGNVRFVRALGFAAGFRVDAGFFVFVFFVLGREDLLVAVVFFFALARPRAGAFFFAFRLAIRAQYRISKGDPKAPHGRRL